MYEVGDYIVYGKSGVCKVEEVGTVDLDGVSKDKIFYTLIPVYSKGSKVFTPVDNEKVIMRPVISEAQARELIDDIKNIETIWITDEKKREEIYKDCMKKCDCRELVKIIKTLYLRKESRIAEGKKVTTSDERYLKLAEESLYGELALPLNMDKDKMEEYIAARIEFLEME